MPFVDHFCGRRVLVTGHTGFKGSWLTLWLSELGAEVTGFALAPDTEPNLFTLARVAERCHHVVGDLRDVTALDRAFERCQPDVVFHLAAQPLVRRSYKEPHETFEVNVVGTINVLESIRRVPSIQTAVLITTDKVYENREWLWGYRENDPLGGFDPYSASKAAAEIAIASYRQSYFSAGGRGRSVGVASTRAGNVLGGGDWAEDRIIPDAVRAVGSGQVLDVRSPRSVRPWQHVLEPLGAYLALAKRLADDHRRFAGAWNVGPAADDVADVGQLIQVFFDNLGKGNWRDGSAEQGGAPHETGLLKLNCDKAYEELEWRPVWDTPRAVKVTAGWYRDVVFSGQDAQSRCLHDINSYTQAACELNQWWAS